MGSRLIFLVFSALMLASCSEYSKVLKSPDLDYKFKKAVEYYEDGKYAKAFPLFDELLTLYRGTAKAQDVYFYYANTHYNLKEYILAAYHFKNFYKTFPNHKDAEEAAFLTGYCYYLESPVYSLDQSYTYKAINELQLFVNTHPESPRVEECNVLIDELRGKLERKSYEVAKQYFHMELYQSAVVALNVTLDTYPDTEYREEAMYMRLVAAYNLAENSIEEKQLQRFREAMTAYNELLEFFPETSHKKQADKLFEETKSQISRIQNQI